MSTDQITKKQEVNHQIVNLELDCFKFFKFIECLEKYIDEMEFILENRELTISFMDASRIMLSKCSMYLSNLHGAENLDKMKFGINPSDLKILSRTRKEDKKAIEIIFDNSKDYIELIKTSEKYDSKITKTLNLLDLDIEEIPMDNLNKIEYPASVSFSTKFLNDFFYESGNYSEIIEIEIDEEKGISFSEMGQIGNSEYLIKREYCNEIEGNEKGSYSYTFLTPIKPLLKILDNDDVITLHIKNDHPIKLEIYLSSLDMNFLIYLAPKVEEEEFDDDDLFDDETICKQCNKECYNSWNLTKGYCDKCYEDLTKQLSKLDLRIWKKKDENGFGSGLAPRIE